jgi:hypothetical protein
MTISALFACGSSNAGATHRISDDQYVRLGARKVKATFANECRTVAHETSRVIHFDNGAVRVATVLMHTYMTELVKV